MIKKILFFLLTTGSLGAFAKQPVPSNKKEVVITGKIDNLPNDSIVILSEPYSQEADTVVVKNHSFKITHPMPKGGSVWTIQIGTQQTLGKGLVLYLEDGHVNITGKGSDFTDVKCTGSTWVDEWQNLMDITSPEDPENRKFEEVKKKYAEAKAAGDDDAMEKYALEGNVYHTAFIQRLKDWVKQHPNSGICGYIITIFMKKKSDKDELYAMLGEHAKSSRIVMRWKHPGKVDPKPTHGMFVKVGEGLKIGDAAPGFTAPDSTGKMISLSDLKGKYVLVDFWASWCMPCKKEEPFLKAAYEKYKNKNFEILGVSLDADKKAWTRDIQKSKLNWLHVSNLKGWQDEIIKAYGFGAIPANVLVGPDGKIIGTHYRGEMLEKKLSEILK